MPKSKLAMAEVRYVYNQVYRSMLSDRYFFAAKVKVLPSGIREVIGSKVDVTDSILGLLASKRPTRKAKAKKASPNA